MDREYFCDHHCPMTNKDVIDRYGNVEIDCDAPECADGQECPLENVDFSKVNYPLLPTVPSVMQNQSVHSFTKEILSMATRHDPVDALHDIELALAAWRNNVDEILKAVPEERDALQSKSTR